MPNSKVSLCLSGSLRVKTLTFPPGRVSIFKSIRISRLRELSGTKSSKKLAAFQEIWDLVSQIGSLRSPCWREEDTYPAWGIYVTQTSSPKWQLFRLASLTLNTDQIEGAKWEWLLTCCPHPSPLLLSSHMCQESPRYQHCIAPINWAHDTEFLNLPALKSKGGHSSYKTH